MLFPKKVKFRKWHTMRKHPSKIGVATRGATLSFGSYGLMAESAGRIKSNQIEAARKAMARDLKKTGKLWIRVFPDMPFTKKPAEVKQGKGKGDVQGYVAPVKPGRILFEIDGLDEAKSREILKKAGAKLPVTTKIITRN